MYYSVCIPPSDNVVFICQCRFCTAWSLNGSDRPETSIRQREGELAFAVAESVNISELVNGDAEMEVNLDPLLLGLFPTSRPEVSLCDAFCCSSDV